MTVATPLDGIVLKGTRHGLLICVREDVELDRVIEQLTEHLEQNSAFLGGSQISLDLGWRELDAASFAQLTQVLSQRNIELMGVLSTSLQTRTVAEESGVKAIIGRLGLAHHQGRELRRAQREAEEKAVQEQASEETEAVEASPAAEVSPLPTAPEGEREQEATLYIKRTLRSGQKAVYPGNIVLWGDLNPGAELEADGDVIVLGTVRGRILAGANGNESAQIYCQSLHPTVLRIADGLWTGDCSEVGVKLPAALRVSCYKDQMRFDATALR